MLTPARAATSPRRRPGTRRCPAWGRPAAAGESLARREVRNSRTSAFTSALLSTAFDATGVRRRLGCLAGTPHERDFFAPASGDCISVHTTCERKQMTLTAE